MTDSITLSTRFVKVLSRYFEVHRPVIVERGLKFPNRDQWLDYFFYGMNNHIKVCFQSEKNEHDVHCPEWNDENTNYIEEGEDCGICDSKEGITFSIQIEITANNRTIETIEFTKDEPIEETIKKFEILTNKTYDFCICGGKVFKEKLCHNCYPHEYTRSEAEGGDCPICYENGGRWCQFVECKHQFHYGCITKIREHPKKCPLCRNAGDFKIDPFDL
jgi:hypothetical protein